MRPNLFPQVTMSNYNERWLKVTLCRIGGANPEKQFDATAMPSYLRRVKNVSEDLFGIRAEWILLAGLASQVAANIVTWRAEIPKRNRGRQTCFVWLGCVTVAVSFPFKGTKLSIELMNIYHHYYYLLIDFISRSYLSRAGRLKTRNLTLTTYVCITTFCIKSTSVWIPEFPAQTEFVVFFCWRWVI